MLISKLVKIIKNKVEIKRFCILIHYYSLLNDINKVEEVFSEILVLH